MADLNPEQWAEVKRLFTGAAELRPEELPDYLQRECPDQDLRREVVSLLEYSGGGLPSAHAAIASAAAAAAQEPDPDERLIGTRLGALQGGGHRGARRHGRGLSRRARRRRVSPAGSHQAGACGGRIAQDSLRRFRQERQILARLSHPNIARLLDGGSTP